jgi:hypothetical protein
MRFLYATVFAFALAFAGLLQVPSTAAVADDTMASCCVAGAACCKDGADCCVKHDGATKGCHETGCCKPGAACCTDGATCCKDGATCCKTDKGACCKDGAACCKKPV